MKVAVLGRGTSSIITTLQLLKHNHEVTVFYDPNLPHINVGESTTVPIANLLYDVLGLNTHDLVSMGLCSYKMGINFVDWGVCKSFHHNFFENNISFHFETQKFNKFIHIHLDDNGYVKYIPIKINKFLVENNKVIICDRLFDFVVNCTGWDSEDYYYEPFFETVNSAILFKKDYPQYSDIHSLHLATEDGWQFGLPFPQESTFKCGYLFNDKLISQDDALKKLPKDADVYEKYSWKPRSRKYLLDTNNIASNGNRLFFFEPLQAMTLHYTNEFALLICEFLENRTHYEFDRINHKYNDYIYSQLLCLAYHYQFGSVHDSEFWKVKSEQAQTIMDASPMGRGQRFIDAIKYDFRYDNYVSKVAWMVPQDHVYIQNGMTGKEWIGLNEKSI